MKEIKTFFSAEVDFKTIPEESGIYIFVSPKQRFTYPNGTSKVIYIGTSKNLRYRLKTHHRNFINKNSKQSGHTADIIISKHLKQIVIS